MPDPTLYLFDGYNLLHAGPHGNRSELVDALASFVATLFYNRGVELVGATRGGQYIHLMPVFGTVLAVLFLHETLHAYHAAGIALIALPAAPATA